MHTSDLMGIDRIAVGFFCAFATTRATRGRRFRAARNATCSLFRGFLFGENEKRAVCARFGGRWSFFVRFFLFEISLRKEPPRDVCRVPFPQKKMVVDPKFDKKYCFFLNVYKNRIPRALAPRPSVERVRSQDAFGQRDVRLWSRLGL